jgi:hypothetical protein
MPDVWCPAIRKIGNALSMAYAVFGMFMACESPHSLPVRTSHSRPPGRRLDGHAQPTHSGSFSVGENAQIAIALETDEVAEVPLASDPDHDLAIKVVAVMLEPRRCDHVRTHLPANLESRVSRGACRGGHQDADPGPGLGQLHDRKIGRHELHSDRTGIDRVHAIRRLRKISLIDDCRIAAYALHVVEIGQRAVALPKFDTRYAVADLIDDANGLAAYTGREPTEGGLVATLHDVHVTPVQRESFDIQPNFASPGAVWIVFPQFEP